MSRALQLRRLLAGERLIVAPGVYDGISAALVGRYGFPAAYMTGAGVSASAYGLPDIGLLTLTEMAERARVLAGLVGVPLIADADTGYGSPINVVRTVREYERAGVAAIQLEDQVFPKRCGHLAGKEVVDAGRFRATLEAALDAREDPDTVIVARTDARAPLGLDEAIARARLYADAGADVIFVEAPESEQEVERIAGEIDAPLLLNVVPGGLYPRAVPGTPGRARVPDRDPSRGGVGRRRTGRDHGPGRARGCRRDHHPRRPGRLLRPVRADRVAAPRRPLRGLRGEHAVSMTIIEKILARGAGLEEAHAGELVVCEVDMTVLIDLQFATMWTDPTRIADPDRVAVIMDHAVPAPSVNDADGGVRARAFVERFAIERFYDVGRHGICHQVIAENGLARPGEILTCTDSHTCAAGAYNAAARGLGPVEVYSILCTGRTWFQIAPTIRYDLIGEKPDLVSGKDIFLHIAGTFGDANNHNLEFGGPGLGSVPMNDRRTIATQGAEVSADFTTFPADELCWTSSPSGSASGPPPSTPTRAPTTPSAVRST